MNETASASRENKAPGAKPPGKVIARILAHKMAERRKLLLSSSAGILFVVLGAFVVCAQQKAPATSSLDDQSIKPLYTPQQEHEFLRGAAPASDQLYMSIDGDHLREYVKEFSGISAHYRDQGHQFCGRITGTEGDVEGRKWLLDKFRQAGLSNVHEQPLDLPPQWLPQSWTVVAHGGSKTLNLQTAQPAYGTPGTPPDGLDLEAVYVGLGSEADFAGRDVHGKAVFLYSIPTPNIFRHSAAKDGAIKRAEEKGAAAIFVVLTLPGNIRTQMSEVHTNVPTFSMCWEDGQSVRDLIGKAAAGQVPHVSVRMDVKMVPDLETATVWGELPVTTDEKIIIVGHRDGFFDGAVDNATGVATMLGLAEHFAKIPKEQRRRTIIFLGTTGHHSTPASLIWLIAHKDEVFAKTALLINCEHTAVALTPNDPATGAEGIRPTNSLNALLWYAGSPRLRSVAAKDFDEFGVVRFLEPNKGGFGENGTIYKFAPSLQLTDMGVFNHSIAKRLTLYLPLGWQRLRGPTPRSSMTSTHSI